MAVRTKAKRRAPARKPAPRRAVPARARRNAKASRGHQHPELIGLGLAALGVFLASVLWAGWDGGVVGGAVADGFRAVIGFAAYPAPIAIVAVGGLMLTRSALVDFRPFRVGLAVTTFGLLATLGRAHGGALGRAFEVGLGKLIGATGVTILGLATLVAGALVLSGVSAGAWLRRSGHAVRRAHGRLRERAETPAFDVVPLAAEKPELPPVDAVADYPDVIDIESEPVVVHQESWDDPISADEQPSLFDVRPDTGDYTLPNRNVLRTSPPAAGNSAAVNAKVAEQLVKTLSHFGVDAICSGTISGPSVTRYELQLAPGTKVSKVAALKDDLSYALATTEIRILAPIPGKQAVGVELPNANPHIVTLGDIFGDLPAGASPLSVWLGKDISGNAVWADLARMPHILIAGTTGSGKSGCINTILTSILLRATPDEARLILIDPKRVELNFYEAIPHLLTPVVSNPKEAAAVLANVVAEMERRYERLAHLRARNLLEANRALRARGEDPLPYLLVVIDELADLMMTTPQAVEDAIIRLAQKSRAVGIHLVLATQRPSVDVITGMIKANVPSRTAFAVSSQTYSRVILDGSGAEALLARGDMLFKPLGTSRLQRVQGAWVSEEEIAMVVEQTRHQREQELEEGFLELPQVFESGAEADDGEFDPDEDPLLEKAIEIVVQTQTASVSLIQRRLRVGYTRAGRLIDMLERRGIISGYEGSKPRRVLVEDTSASPLH
ncbi:MAG: DNA translocase FtsK [Gaiellaceae bacterium]